MVNSSIRFFYNGLYNKRFKKRFDESYGFSSTLGSNYKVGEYTVNISNGFQQCSQKISISGTACAPAATAPDFCAGQPFNANLLGDPLPNLTVGDIITAGAFEYTITQVSSATLPFAGKATMNILNGPANLKAGLKTEFAGININECYQVTLVPPITTTTYFRSEYDPSWGNIFDASTNTPKPAEPGEEINALIAVNEKIATEMEAFTNGCAQRERLVQYLAELNAIMAQIQASIYYNSTEKTDIANSQNAVTIVLNSLVGVGGCLTACDPNARVAAPASVNCVVAIDVETTNANLILANEAKIAELNRDGLKIKYVNRIINGKTLYSCNCGWIDTDHGFAGSTQINPAIGLDNLWRNLKNQTGKKSNSYGYNGFKISYRQEAKGLGYTFDYFVPYGLNLNERKSIALYILREVSLAFEELQWGGFLLGDGSSAYEVADLVSNQLGLYSRMENLTKDQILNSCVKSTPEQSLQIYKSHPNIWDQFVFTYRNYNFTPIYFSNNFCPTPNTFPFNYILPFTYGYKGFREWTTLDD